MKRKKDILIAIIVACIFIIPLTIVTAVQRFQLISDGVDFLKYKRDKEDEIKVCKQQIADLTRINNGIKDVEAERKKLEQEYQNKWSELNLRVHRQEEKLELEMKKVKENLAVAIKDREIAKNEKVAADESLRKALQKQNDLDERIIEVNKQLTAKQKQIDNTENLVKTKLDVANKLDKNNQEHRMKLIKNLQEQSDLLAKHNESYDKATGDWISVSVDRIQKRIPLVESALKNIKQIDKKLLDNDIEIQTLIKNTEEILKAARKRR